MWLFACRSVCSPLEYKKAESQTNLELKAESDFEAVLRQEEDHIKQLCDAIIKVGTHDQGAICDPRVAAGLLTQTV